MSMLCFDKEEVHQMYAALKGHQPVGVVPYSNVFPIYLVLNNFNPFKQGAWAFFGNLNFFLNSGTNPSFLLKMLDANSTVNFTIGGSGFVSDSHLRLENILFDDITNSAANAVQYVQFAGYKIILS